MENQADIALVASLEPGSIGRQQTNLHVNGAFAILPIDHLAVPIQPSQACAILRRDGIIGHLHPAADPRIDRVLQAIEPFPSQGRHGHRTRSEWNLLNAPDEVGLVQVTSIVRSGQAESSAPSVTMSSSTPITSDRCAVVSG